MESKMKRILMVAAVLLVATAVSADAKTRHAARPAASSGVTAYDHDSPDPNVGWHWDSNGMRVCHQDCDNPEIPGSGAKCRNVNWMGMAARECVTGGDF
jgi:predicted lipoprotein